MNIQIERAACEDAAELLACLKQMGAETDNLTFGAEGLPVSVEDEMAYIRQMEDSCDQIMLVAKDNGKIVGNAALSRLPRRMQHRGDFCISVLKSYWNKGIGSLLLSEIIRYANDNSFEVLDLQVRSDNSPAIHLYEKFGFVKIGTHPYFFKMGDEEISFDYMCLKIQ